MVIEHLLDQLPTSVPYNILCFRTMETINDVLVDNITAFIKFTDEVLKIDNTYRCTSSSRSNPARNNNNITSANSGSAGQHWTALYSHIEP